MKNTTLTNWLHTNKVERQLMNWYKWDSLGQYGGYITGAISKTLNKPPTPKTTKNHDWSIDELKENQQILKIKGVRVSENQQILKDKQSKTPRPWKNQP